MDDTPLAGVLGGEPAPAPVPSAPGRLATTPECICNGTPPVPDETDGAFYRPFSRRTTSFLDDVDGGTRLDLSGRVVSTSGDPVPGALLDFWQVDRHGEYDEPDRRRLWGHQFADEEGRWRLATIVPGTYAPRTRHVHARVQAPGGRPLTTMLYFPGERRNHLDKHFREECLLDVREAGDGLAATFTFVVEA